MKKKLKTESMLSSGSKINLESEYIGKEKKNIHTLKFAKKL